MTIASELPESNSVRAMPISGPQKNGLKLAPCCICNVVIAPPESP